MTQDLVQTGGSEALVSNGLDGETVEVGLYNDAVDGLAAGSVEADVTSEPGNGNYARVTVTLEKSPDGDRYVAQNASSISFDFSDQKNTSEIVDTGFFVHGTYGLLANPSLTQDRDIRYIDSLDVSAGELFIGVDNQ